LTTSFKSYFEGKRELFDGLKIMGLEKSWTPYPIIHIDLSLAKDQDGPESLRFAIKDLIDIYCQRYGIDYMELTPGQCLRKIIENAYATHDSRVVVLIDEYDAPLLDVLHEKEQLDGMRKVMREFYQPLKACEGMIRFCFLTGITKFSPVSIFSTLNNIKNISMIPDYATICGITEHELTTVLSEDIDMMAEAYEVSHDEMHALLKRQYDGYHFTKKSEEVYNPYSLFNCFDQKEINNFWFQSGTPTFLFNQMRRFKTDITGLDNIEAPESEFYLPTENLDNALPLLYQAGYLTIKDYNPKSQMYTLSIPNQEVRIGFAEGLMPIYTGLPEGSVQAGCAYKMWDALDRGDIDLCMRELKAFLAGVPYVEGFREKLKDAATKEGFYEYTFYLILSMLNVYVQTQVKCWTGRIDAIIHCADTIYVLEFKTKVGADAALQQIDDKGYADRFATDPRKVVKVGVNFDIDTWTINDWAIES